MSDTIVIDTQKLRDYGLRLNTVNSHIKSIDRRMDSLYTKVGINGLFDLLQADVMTTYSMSLKNVAMCLDESAEVFDICENSLLKLDVGDFNKYYVYGFFTDKEYVQNIDNVMAASIFPVNSERKGVNYSGDLNDFVKGIYDEEIDQNRTSDENVLLQSTTQSESKYGSVNIFGEEYNYEEINGINTVYIGSSSGEGYANGGFNTTQIIKRYIIDDNITVDLNRLDSYLTGDFDRLKGNAYGMAGLKWTLASAETTADFGFGNTHVGDLTLGASAGVGFNVKAGIHDGKFEFSVDAGLLIGAKVGITINYDEILEGISNFFKW